MLNSFFRVCERCLFLDVVRCWVMGHVSYLYFVYDIIIGLKESSEERTGDVCKLHD